MYHQNIGDLKAPDISATTLAQFRTVQSNSPPPFAFGQRKDGFPVLSDNVQLSLSPGANTADHLWIPVARDRTAFLPAARLKKGFRLGPKGDQEYASGFTASLDILRQMRVPHWRRPSATTQTPGIVSAIGWTRIPCSQIDNLA